MIGRYDRSPNAPQGRIHQEWFHVDGRLLPPGPVRIQAPVSVRTAAHGASWKTSPSVCRWPDRITETPCRTGAADQPRAERTGRSRVVNR